MSRAKQRMEFYGGEYFFSFLHNTEKAFSLVSNSMNAFSFCAAKKKENQLTIKFRDKI